ncbi:hypothetical protein ES288_A03G028100v1 [Gossypium darwinii]|uniref:Uncharacterized protein n=1 Tax=Gossypium darwinii TaxID=34276 RepID=A0A5D2H2G2_GOSDA|nr:hypothetical protein ES288_A03G028100v1 [Gossypium darwinii]
MFITKTRTFILSVVYLVGTKQWTSRPAREEDHCIHLDCDGFFFFFIFCLFRQCSMSGDRGIRVANGTTALTMRISVDWKVFEEPCAIVSDLVLIEN